LQQNDHMEAPFKGMTLWMMLATCLAILPAVSSGEPAEIDLRELPGLERIEVERADGGSTGLTILRNEAGDIAFSDARAVIDGRRIGMSAGASLREPSAENRVRISVSGMQISLDGKPASDAACDWLDSLDVINLSDVIVTPHQAGEAGLSGLSMTSLAFQANDATSPCVLNGVVTVNDLKVTMGDGSGIVFDRAAFRVSLPFLEASSGESESNAVLSGLILGFEYRRAGEVPAFGFPETEVRFSATRSSLSPMFTLVERIARRSSSVPAALDGMQAWNVVTAMNGSLGVSGSSLRIYAPGAVPSEMVANFSRAGLSTISGSGSLSLDLADRVFDAEVAMSLTGLVDASISARGAALPFVREKLEGAASGRDLGWHLLPDIIVEGASLSWEDRGLDRAVIDITGVPAGRQLEEIAAIVSKREGDASSILLGGIASFLRLGAEGRPVAAFLDPRDPQRLAALLFGLLTDPIGIAGKAGFSLSR
jgi:hypothetical protein